MREAGIRRFVVVIGAEEGELASYLSNSWYPNIEVQYVLQAVPKGPVDAILLAENYLEGAFVVAAGDNLPAPEHVPALLAAFDQGDYDGVLSVIPYEDNATAPVAVVEDDDRCVKAIVSSPYTGPEPASALYLLHAFRPEFSRYLKQVRPAARGERDLTDAIRLFVEDGNRVGFLGATGYHSLFTEHDLMVVNTTSLDEGRDAHILSELPNGVTIHPPVRIDPGVRVGNYATIGPYVYLEHGCTVGEGAQLASTIVLRNSAVAPGETCQDVIIMREKRIPV
jgi:dTDP-glucose pyrophosphorylase